MKYLELTHQLRNILVYPLLGSDYWHWFDWRCLGWMVVSTPCHPGVIPQRNDTRMLKQKPCVQSVTGRHLHKVVRNIFIILPFPSSAGYKGSIFYTLLYVWVFYCMFECSTVCLSVLLYVWVFYCMFECSTVFLSVLFECSTVCLSVLLYAWVFYCMFECSIYCMHECSTVSLSVLLYA